MVNLHTTVVATCAVAVLLGSALYAVQSPQGGSAPGVAPGAAPPGATGGASAPGSPGAAGSTGVVDSPWPQTATSAGITFAIDRPSFTALQGNQAELTAPLQVTMADGSTMSGSVRISATLAPADQSGEVELNRMAVIGATLDGIDDTTSVQDAMNALLDKAAITVQRAAIVQEISVDPVTTPGLNHEPPTIKVVETPTVLLAINGPPHSLPLGSTGWRSVTNTPFIVLLDPNGNWFLRLGQSDWRGARSINGPWQQAPTPPDAVIAALGSPPPLPPEVQQNQQAADQSRAATQAPPPAVLVATEPTVLVSLNGAPQLSPLCEGVQGAHNTDSVLLRTATPDRWWTLASGRWFAAQNLNGPWGYVAPKDLPAAFANLPQTGQYSSALASVPNTTAAKEAVLANAEMRTVTVDRSQATCDVKYQGAARMAPVTGTAMYYAVNANQPVVKVGNAFYCCESAAWFTAPSGDGPWSLCDTVPEAIYTIPPSCPIFACTFVEVLGSTATTVSYGFTPGYVGSYLQDGTAVYGTGYNYPPADLGGGATQPYPQTYGSDPGYDADSGTFAPPTGSTYIDDYPAVQPIYYSDGYGGWGWCGGWCTSWGYGWGNWGYWNHWNHYWNNWHPDNNRWNHNWNQWQHANNLEQQNRQNLADRGRGGVNNWQRGTTNPGGERPTRNPGGEVPTRNPGGEVPTRNPGGETPTRTPGGEIPTRNPGGETPTRYPGGEAPTRYPGGQVPTRYPASRSYARDDNGGYGNYGSRDGNDYRGTSGYSGFHPAYHSQAGSYGGGYRAPQYGNSYRGGGQMRGGGGMRSGGGGGHGGGGGGRR